MIIKMVVRILIKSVIIISKQKMVVTNVWMPTFISIWKIMNENHSFYDDLWKLRKLFKYEKIKDKKIDL